MPMPRPARYLVLVTAVLAMVVAGCSTASTGGLTGLEGSRSSGGPGQAAIRVVAAENFWGSLAAQLGGDRREVTSIINSPDADPHDYEPTAADGRAIAGAQLVDRQRRRLRRVGGQAGRRQPGRRPHAS